MLEQTHAKVAFVADRGHSGGVLSWTHDTVLFTALTLTAAVWALLHLSLSLRAARAESLPTWARALGFLPPLTPVAGYLGGAKVRAVLWCIVAITYLVLRTWV